MENEKKAKFIQIATPRVNNVKKSIRILSNCSSDNYDYTEEDINEMFEVLYTSLNETEAKFRERFKEDKEFAFPSAKDISLIDDSNYEEKENENEEEENLNENEAEENQNENEEDENKENVEEETDFSSDDF